MRPQNGSLRPHGRQPEYLRTVRSEPHKVVTPEKVRRQPAKSVARHAKRLLVAAAAYVAVDGVEGCRQIQQQQHSDVAMIKRFRRSDSTFRTVVSMKCNDRKPDCNRSK
jgi:hypothetical protein